MIASGVVVVPGEMERLFWCESRCFQEEKLELDVRGGEVALAIEAELFTTNGSNSAFRGFAFLI